MRDNFEAGWYFPAEEAIDDFWNPYYCDGNGTWYEAQTEGHVEIDFPYEIQWPLKRVQLGQKIYGDPREQLPQGSQRRRTHERP